jgi:hypothetical protein
MSNTMYASAINPEVDEFLKHFGIKGMKWGVRKARPVSGMGRSGRSSAYVPATRIVAPAPVVRSSRPRGIAAGQARIDHSTSTGKAILGVAGRFMVEGVLVNAAGLAASKIPNSSVRMGAEAALGVVGLAVTVKSINDGVNIARAASANKKAGTSK